MRPYTTAADAAAAASIVGSGNVVPTSARLTVVIIFADGTQRDVTSDSRTNYAVVPGGANLIAVSQAGIVTAVAPTGTGGQATVNVSFAGFPIANHLSQTITLTVLATTGASLELFPFPSYVGSVSTTTLRAVGCTGGVVRHG